MRKQELSKRKLLNRLNKELSKMYSVKEQEKIEWAQDKENKETYSWNYFVNGLEYSLVINKYTGMITRVGRS
ncbi:hypothetical protein P5815_31990 [Bacillus cereus]|uniref:hypothetical protein n=1 Tax=Bacillus cereus TaxID=1396 RepID=UPI0024055745|nr:hypothetical protein [Bacillus cereus]MDF9525110.1 hypothetical protein [Bacillus cereus]MDF9565151.1 hypothetical protein [Bacillus cereus]